MFSRRLLRSSHRSRFSSHLPTLKYVLQPPKSCFTWSRKQTGKLKERGVLMARNIKQPYRALLIFIVGKSHCAEAVESIKEMAYCMTNLFCRQCKVHTSQKVHQMLQFYSFYLRMWGEEMTRQMISNIRKSLMSRGKTLLISAVCLTPYDWNKNIIQDEKLESCIAEYEIVDALTHSTVYCEQCKKRQIVDKKIPKVEYCMCHGRLGYIDRSHKYDNWEPFLERENILVWRRKHHQHSHLYSYKVYGKYDDMSLSAFMEVQLNASFRTQWDSSALELKVMNSHQESNSDLMYWLVKFPHFFANRDYVFNRRYRVDKKKKEVIILNEIAEHPLIPEEKGVHRVKDYWSTMVLRANAGFHQPGMSYTLTYFDNPGTSLPAAVTNFVASTAFPDFLSKVHKAAMSLQRRWATGEDVYVTLPPLMRFGRDGCRRGVKLPQQISIDTDVLVRESREKETPKLSQFRVIKEAIMEADNAKNKQSEVEYKIPLRFKKVVIDLLEAMEVVSPEYEQKTALTTKIESLLDNLGLDKDRKNSLVKKLEFVRSRTKSFMNDAARKREESIKIMNEFERRRHYYDQSFADEKSIVLLKGLLHAINDVLKADKDMRTGRSISEAESDSCEGRTELRDFGPDDESNIIKENGSKDKNSVGETECNCCQNQSLADKDGAKNLSWYSYFGFAFSFWPNKSEGKDPEQKSNSCTCTHKTAPESTAASESNPKIALMESLGASWYHHIRGLFVSNAAPIEPPDQCPKPSSEEGESATSGSSNLTVDKVEESRPWYFFSWITKFWTQAGV